MIKSIIFDFGNVLCTFTNEIFINKISILSGKSSQELFELIYKKSGLPKQFESGLLTSHEFYEKIKKLCNLNITYDELKQIYSEGKFTPVPGMDEVVAVLKQKYKISLLSNTSDWDIEYGIKLFPSIKLFDTISLSYETKAMKPDAKIFRDALNKIGFLPEECAYTDDIMEYVNVARSLGINGIHFKGKDNFIASLKRLGVDIN